MNILWKKIEDYYRLDETQCINEILESANYSDEFFNNVQIKARQLAQRLRDKQLSQNNLNALMFQYDIVSEEGLALMCLAEALLRIPDKATLDKLIRDKLSARDWQQARKKDSFFSKATSWALRLSERLAGKKGAGVIVRQAVGAAMRLLGRQFVMAQTITAALKRAQSKELKGYRFSYDMLGEAALTANDAERYWLAYQAAIDAIAKASNGRGPIEGPGVSVKLSALHPRFSVAKQARLEKELYPKLEALVLQAKRANIGLTIDAEEAHTLTITLTLIEKIITSGILGEWQGLGLAVQAYQKRAPHVLAWLIDCLEKHQAKMMVRLVKGAYWDTEIKLTQVQGLKGYPVFTRKASTDLNYIVCAQKMLSAQNVLYAQFATHNAFTLATINELAQMHQVTAYEFQCLHGMGEALYDDIVGVGEGHYPCRVYAPVGTYEDLLAYLVRRLLENGANSSFVNKIMDSALPIEDMIISPIKIIKNLKNKPNPHIPLPKDLFSPSRQNSRGLDLSAPNEFLPVLHDIQQYPIKHKNRQIQSCTVEEALKNSETGYQQWKAVSPNERAEKLENMAALLEDNANELMSLLVFEAGKTIDDAVSEVREAVDFCRYYASQTRLLFAQPMVLAGPTGEQNQLSLHGLGTLFCISPWNFPLAIFLGQVAASLAAGNAVIAKPASQTVVIASRVVEFFHEAGVPEKTLQLIIGKGSVLGDVLVKDSRIHGVLLTGSTETARHINQQLALRKGPIVRFIAETGGQNAMIVDSSALPEQVTQDVITSAFRSAGQRCSALRVLFLQEDVADKMITMIKGAMAELQIGNPAELSTDMGPVIDNAAKAHLEQHIEKMKRMAKHLYETPLSAECEQGAYVSAHLIEIPNLAMLTEEVFGPILHVIRYASTELDNVIEQINHTGYGLTLGIHSRIHETIRTITEKVNVGNIYVNRNMIGAVVGVQPFGGEGLSGTGPKAGGPYYLPRLAVERVISINTTASGGNATLISLEDNYEKLV